MPVFFQRSPPQIRPFVHPGRGHPVGFRASPVPQSGWQLPAAFWQEKAIFLAGEMSSMRAVGGASAWLPPPCISASHRTARTALLGQGCA